MRYGWVCSRLLGLSLVVVSLVSTLIPITAARVEAEDTIPLTVSVSSFWEDVLTPDVLAEFEAAHAGVDVVVTYTDTGFFGFGGMSETVDTRLDSTEEFVTSADVLYVDSSSLSAEDTQAGYFLDLSPLVMNDPALNTSDFIPAVWQSFQWDNGIWALPLSTDVILMTYDTAAFDAAGVAYPNERWTIDDFANAARVLTVYDADGSVSTPGMTASSGGDNFDLLVRALLGAGLYDAATMPNAPTFANPAIETILQTWYELQQEGVVASGGGMDNDTPLSISGVFGYSSRGFRPGQEEEETVLGASLLPGGVAGLNVQAFAVSAGSQYPELAYELAKFLTQRSELASNSFSASPARYSLMNSTASETTDNGQPGGGGPGGGPGGRMQANIPDAIQPVVDQGLTVGLPISELRYTSYLSSALSEMSSNGGDALSAIQTVEALAISDVQTAQARRGTVTLYVEPPAAEPVLAAGEIELNCAVNLGFGGRGPGSQFSNQDLWDQLIADFVASDPEVGIVNLESVEAASVDQLATEYDCIIMPSNVVPDSDLSVLLNLDPLIDTDPTFDRNDVIGNTLAQLQQDSKTWALPIAVEPQVLQYNQDLFAMVGLAEPVSGWTVDTFVDALQTLKSYNPDTVPFMFTDGGGSALMMLIGAFGGLPIDYRTDPVTYNFTDPAAVDAIRQVLDLAIQGYISYDGLTEVDMSEMQDAAITTSSLNQFNMRPPQGPNGEEQATMVTTTYPQGTQYNVIAYSITTGYISATAQNPEAAYRFLSTVALNPQLFSGMPARASLLSDPDVIAAQGEDIVTLYQQLDTLMRASNTIVFPTMSGMGGGNALNFIQRFWLNRAFDRYVLEGADLEQELADAAMYTQAFIECTGSIQIDPALDADEQRRQQGEAMRECVAVDPTFTIE